ncbi:MFS transporter [Helicobacter mustelae]|uniref:Alpha-ketoglutarate permease n=1 Tax=Helicobacter mustelae (strain ATCC 43772 / CCUG 25715 / CIP 103759 / LMG 18044 / NCTC 12198 / R85-136P) TaxID=679897 RepID=D3UJD8_HELM1|nr:MFS transporter [Helicobacter mustelae]CBG40614.1 alpha-ketoglutarate permease [Helicobacter mustelae 12198]SQH72112.1 alpha-ketoglutarate permease [Helicobacter mustelae]
MEQITQTKRIGSIFAASSGNLVEWFDFYIFAFGATYFAHAFSVSNSELIQQIHAFGVFAIGFFMRPLGSYLFGSLADKVGRKKSMIFSVILMALGSFLIAVLPGKEIVGDFAILFLLLARLLQGLSVGGEYGVVATYLSELAKEGRRGFYSSFQYVTLIGGQLLAVASISIMLLFFSAQEMYDYAWRFLFVLGGVLALASLFLRNLMEESSSPPENHKQSGTLEALWKYKGRFFLVIGITAGGSLSFYAITIYIKTYLIGVGMSKELANNLLLPALFCLMVMQPLFGMLGDRIGHKRQLAIFGLLALCLVYPIFSLLAVVQNAFYTFLLVLGLFVILSFYTSIAGIFKAKLFPEHVRALGTGLGYAIANAIFGGSASYVALQFKSAGYEKGFFVYMAVVLMLMLIAIFFLPKKSELE